MANCLDTAMVILVWNEIPGQPYIIQISRTVDFSDIVVTAGVGTDTTYTFSSMLPNQTYYWKVNTPDEESATWNFRTLKNAPAKVQPINNNTCVGKSYLFKWRSIANATYMMQISTVANFSSTIETLSGLTDTTALVTLPSYNTRYYWRIQADYDGCITFISPADSFVTQRAPATLGTPANNVNSVSKNGIRMSWSAATAPTNYVLQVSTDSSFSSIFHEYIGTNTNDSVSGLTNNTFYYWRVRMDYSGCYTEWTPFRTFRTEYETPVNLIPRQDSLCVPLDARLRWDAVFEAVTYRVQISEVMDFSTTVLDSSGIDIYYMNYVFPKAEQTYYWRVKVEDPNNSSKWSATTWLTTAITYPTRITPVNGTDNLTQTIVFKWNKTNQYSYERVQISNDSSFQTVLFDVRNIGADSLVRKMPDQFVTYYWRISSELNLCVSTWSQGWSFRTVLLPPVLNYPENGATNQSFALTLEWLASEGATTYDFHLSKEPTFTTIENGKTGIPGTKVYINNLEPSTKYFWRVNANNTGGKSVWSETFEFTTAAEALDVPTLISPLTGTDKIPVNKVDLVWHPVDRATKYTIQVADNDRFERPIINQPDETDTVYTLTSMTYGTTYYWRVMAANDSLQSSWSNEWAFATVVQLPTDAPILTSPEDNQSPAPTEQTFTWEGVERAENYEFEIAYDSQFTNIFIQDTNVFLTQKYVSNIDFEQTFSWRVRAKNYSGKGPWSETRTFTTLLNSVDDELVSMYNASITPNPIADAANLSLTLPRESNVQITLYDAAGSAVQKLQNKPMSTGTHTIAINSQNLSNGAYFATLVIDNQTFTIRFIVSK